MKNKKYIHNELEEFFNELEEFLYKLDEFLNELWELELLSLSFSLTHINNDLVLNKINKIGEDYRLIIDDYCEIVDIYIDLHKDFLEN